MSHANTVKEISIEKLQKEANLILLFVKLIKVPQTGLLLITMMAGFMCSSNPAGHGVSIFLLGTLGMFLAVSGTTMLNMVWDRDIDAIMDRTKNRPLPTKKLTAASVLWVGNLMVLAGVGISYSISIPYGFVVFAGFFLDFLIYTVLLKRTTPWSIVFGGISGGMPILGGRVLAEGNIEIVGILLTLAILLWIPTHILTLAMNHARCYKLAGVPTFPTVYGFMKTKYFIVLSNVGASLIMFYACFLLNLSTLKLLILMVGNILLVGMSVWMIIEASEKKNFILFRMASFYMVLAMLILMF